MNQEYDSASDLTIGLPSNAARFREEIEPQENEVTKRLSTFSTPSKNQDESGDVVVVVDVVYSSDRSQTPVLSDIPSSSSGDSYNALAFKARTSITPFQSPLRPPRRTVLDEDEELRNRCGTCHCCGRCCLCGRKCLTSIKLPLVLLVFLTIFLMLGTTAFWAAMFGSEKTRRRASEHHSSFLQNIRVTESKIDAMIESIAYSLTLTHGDHLVSLYQGLPSTNDSIIRVWATLTNGVLKSLRDSRLGFGMNIALSSSSEISIWYGNGLLQAGNFSGAGILNAYAVSPSWSSIANHEPYTLTPLFSHPLSPSGDSVPEIYAGEFRAGEMAIGIWGCGYYEYGCQVMITHAVSRRLTTGVEVQFRVSALTSIFSDILAAGCDESYDCVRSWIYDVNTDALIAVSGISSMEVLVHSNFSLNRLKTLQEFGDEFILAITTAALAELDRIQIEGGPVEQEIVDAEVQSMIVFSSRGWFNVHFGLVEYEEFDGEFLVVRAVTQWSMISTIVGFLAGSLAISLGFIAVLSIGWTVFVTCCVFRPIQGLVRRMVAGLTQMDLEIAMKTEGRGFFSIFREIRLLQDQFVWMFDRLVQWRKYLPPTLVKKTLFFTPTKSKGEGNVSNDDGEDSSNASKEIDCGSPDLMRPFPPSSSLNIANRSVMKPTSLDPLFLSGLSEISGSFVIVQFQPFDLASNLSFFENVLTQIEHFATRWFGAVIDMNLDSFSLLAAFGIAEFDMKRSSLQTQHVAAFVDAVRPLQDQFALTMGVASGAAMTGIVGSLDQKKTVHCGESIARAKWLAAEAENDEEGVLVDISFFDRFVNEFQGRSMCSGTSVPRAHDVAYDSLTRRVIVLLSLEKLFHDVADDSEWMYEHEKQERMSQVQAINSAFVDFAKDDLKKCRKTCAKFDQSDSAVLAKLESVCSRVDGTVADWMHARLVRKNIAIMGASAPGSRLPSVFRLFGDAEV